MTAAKKKEHMDHFIADKIDADDIIIFPATGGTPAWRLGDVKTQKDYDSAYITLKMTIESIEDQLRHGSNLVPKTRKALVLKRLALDILDRRFNQARGEA